jgi:glycosyltransferase involved in cell wall biosynthesis
MREKKSILVVCDYFIPGYRSGGPRKSILNLLCALAGGFNFIVFTRDHDLDVRQPYPDGQRADIIRRMPFVVRYASGCLFNLAYLRCLRRTRYDAIYLNSFFSPWQTIRYLLYRKLGLVPQVPILLAPRGEFAAGALGIKVLKKRLYLSVARRLLFSEQLGVTWHASTSYEADDIKRMGLLGRRVVNAGNCTRVAADIAGLTGMGNDSPRASDQVITGAAKQGGSLRIIFLSRISKVKNLQFAIRVVKRLRATVQFDIYGPLEDRGYWDACQAEMQGADASIRIAYHGSVHPTRVTETFKRYHVMLLPTEGENYGHVIVEALLAGCPVIISRTTPWRELREHDAGEDCPLGDEQAFISALSRFADMDEARLRESSAAAIRYAMDRCRVDEVIEANRTMLNELVGLTRA